MMQLSGSARQSGEHFFQIGEVVRGQLNTLLHRKMIFRVQCVEPTVARLVNRADKFRDGCDTIPQSAIICPPTLLTDVVESGRFPLKVLQRHQ